MFNLSFKVVFVVCGLAVPLVHLHNPSPLKRTARHAWCHLPARHLILSSSQIADLCPCGTAQVYCTSVTSGFASNYVKFSFMLVQGTRENNMLMPSQLAGSRDQQGGVGPPLSQCLAQAASFVPPVITCTHESCTSQSSLHLWKMLGQLLGCRP